GAVVRDVPEPGLTRRVARVRRLGVAMIWVGVGDGACVGSGCGEVHAVLPQSRRDDAGLSKCTRHAIPLGAGCCAAKHRVCLRDSGACTLRSAIPDDREREFRVMRDLPSGTVTFLLTDVEGSTPLWEVAPEAMRLALV